MTRNALVIGCGTIGSALDEGTTGEVALTHSTGYQLHEYTRLVAGVEPDSDRRKQFQASREVPVYTDLEEALKNHEVDLVSVCTTPDTHASIINRLTESEVQGILCEKPLAPDTDTAADIVSDCEDADMTLAVNYFRRYLPSFQIARTMLRNGAIGKPKQAILVYNKGFINNGSHVVDLVRWWFDEVDEVVFATGTEPSTILRCDDTHCHIVHAGNFSYNHIQVDIYGERGRLQLLDNGRYFEWQCSRDSTLFDGFQELAVSNRLGTDLEWMFYFVIDDFFRSIAGTTTPACDGTAGAETLALCKDILAASE